MPYRAEIQENPDYIRVEISGERRPGKEAEDFFDIWPPVADLCEKTRIQRILLVLRLAGRVPPTAAYEMVKSIADFGWPKSMRVAVVDLNEESRRDHLVTETIAFTRGYRLKIFADEEEARTWLLE